MFKYRTILISKYGNVSKYDWYDFEICNDYFRLAELYDEWMVQGELIEIETGKVLKTFNKEER